jgi:hypothetical protein
MMTDAYGDIPYFEAAQAVQNVINQPVYDTQEAIYRDMLKELKEAAAQLGSQADQLSFGNADILYKGDVAKWKKFANSLRLRLAIRARFANATLAAEHINDVVSGNNLIEANTDNAALKTLQPSATENSTNVNFVYNYGLTNITPMFVGFGITDVMIPTNDPRMPIFFSPAIKNPNTYRGRPLQLNQVQKVPYPQDSVSSVGPILKAPIYEIIVMNAAEVDFLRAEAAFANITSGNANTLYRSGIQKSMAQYGVPQADITEFLNQGVGSLTGTDEEKFEKISTQRYISMFFQAHQGWAEYRRTGYPKIWIGGEVGIINSIPRRFTYPDDEYQKNEDNVKAAAGRLTGSGDKMDSRVWWDKRPGLPYTHPKQNIFPPN